MFSWSSLREAMRLLRLQLRDSLGCTSSEEVHFCFSAATSAIASRASQPGQCGGKVPGKVAQEVPSACCGR